MIKVMWFLKRAPHLTLEEFHHWWLNVHAPDIADDQTPYLKKYVVDLRVADDSALAGKPAGESAWDGIAEQYFDTIEDYNAVYSRTDRPTRADTLAHTSAFERLVVAEHPIDMPAVIAARRPAKTGAE
jgi:hypothetical protein